MARVCGALRRRGRTEHEAEDLVQEAWLRLARYENDRQRQVDQPEAFVMQAAMNLGIDAYRMKVTRGEEVLVENVVIVDTAPSVEAVVLAKERMARLSLGLNRLNPRTRAIFLAHRLDGMTYAEIAEAHGVTISTVCQLVAKATLRLTTWMEGW